MNSLIAITEKEIGAGYEQCVNGRDLHEFLGVRRDFTTWIKDRIEEYGFQQGIDYEVFPEKVKNYQESQEDGFFPKTGEKSGRGRPYMEYSLTVEMAKELSMLEKNEQGKIARKYFIDCERRLKDVNTEEIGNFAAGLRTGIALNRMLKRNGLDLADMARFAWYRKREITQREVAKIFGITRDKAREIEKMLKASGVAFPDIISSKRSKEMRDLLDDMLGYGTSSIPLTIVQGGLQ